MVATLLNGGVGDGYTVIIDQADGTWVRTVQLHVAASLIWSPQSDRLLGTLVAPKDSAGNPGFAIIDVATGAIVTHTPPTVSHCTDCAYAWTRDGTRVTLAIAGADSSEANITVSEVDVFDAATGAARPTVAINGFPTDPFAWSPDGIHAIGQTAERAGGLRVVRPAGAYVGRVPCDGRFIDDQTIVCAIDPSEVDTYLVDGPLTARALFGEQLIYPADIPRTLRST